MIGRLTGRVIDCSPGRLLLDVGGVGYDLHIPLGTFYELSDHGGAPVSLHVHTHVREDVLQLFGFLRLDDRAVFEKLIGISGVGPRLALSILSGIGADELRVAIEREDRERLQKIPGVGKKTAERVILELRDKMKVTAASAAGRPAPSSGEGGDGLRADAVSALVNLGYPADKAEKAVARARGELGPEAGLEALIKGALVGIVG